MDFHCCLFSPRQCADELSLRVTVLKVGGWSRTFRLPGHKRRMASLEPVTDSYECRHARIQGPGLTVPPRCGSCGEMKPASRTSPSPNYSITSL